jgi:glycosyltransferase involved in cell wall biosynthesis
MKILIGCGDYSTISGVPMFVHTLAVELHARGHHVRVVAPNVNGVMAAKTREAGVHVSTFDGVRGNHYDVVHANGIHTCNWASHQQGLRVIATVHSTLVYETPFLHDSIRHYVAVRPQIREKIIAVDGVQKSRATVIFNGVDRTRFASNLEKFDTPTVAFVGTVDYLREQASRLAMRDAAERGWNILFLGRKLSGHLDDLPDNASYQEGDVWDIENVIGRCVATAGILLGRTTIEGWWAGLPGFIYEIDNDGRVVSSGLHDPPAPQIMEMFDARFMADRYEELYERV